MSNNRKFKKPKRNTPPATNTSTSTNKDNVEQSKEPLCPLLAKDSEWVDILQTPAPPVGSSCCISDDEELVQLVESENGPQTKPLAVMFPKLLEQDPQTLQGVLTRAMSTTEVTKHLVDLGQKANFTFMKKADRLIPPEKQWMESLTENSSSICSIGTTFSSSTSDYEADSETTTADSDEKKPAKIKNQPPAPE